MPTYLFYDLETSGLNKAFDQVLQFAAIRTDLQFNELERHNIRIKLRDDIIPSPDALLTNRLTLDVLLTGEPEYEAAVRIHRMFNTPGTISLGYNTLRFDDEFLRFTFYRNLLRPYTHQYSQGCYRMDMLPITIFFWLYRPGILKWPMPHGKPSLKLEYLSEANGLADGPAHDALVDVEATVALARNLSRETDMWHYLTDGFTKPTDRQRLEKLPGVLPSDHGDHALGLMIASEFGLRQQFQAPVLGLGHSVPYANQTLWLCLDKPQLRETTPDTIDANTWVMRKRLGEPGFILPPHDRYWGRLDPAVQAEVEANQKWLRDNPALFAAIGDHHRQFRYPEIPETDLDAALYMRGFMPDAEERICERFHAADLETKIRLTDRFEDPLNRQVARRLLFRNYPDAIPDSINTHRRAFLEDINPSTRERALVDYKGAGRRLALDALERIRELRKTESRPSGQLNQLDELDRYLRNTFAVRDKDSQSNLPF